MINKYEIQARIFPAIITIFPLLIFSHFYLYGIIPGFIDSILVKIIGDISIVSVLLFLIIQISRFISKKFLQDSIFQNELYFPTTNYLLYSNNKYTAERKKSIRLKIMLDFDLKLLDKKEESEFEIRARKRINEAVGLIRNKIKNGRLLLQHNVEYGFVRNLIGGIVVSLPLSVFNLIFFIWRQDAIAIIISIILFLFYLILLFFKNIILIYYANNYADVLFNEYLSFK